MKPKRPKQKLICTPVKRGDFSDWLTMGIKLWPHHKNDLRETFRTMLKSKTEAALLCRSESGGAVGFANLSLRSDYVEGSHTSPVGYLERIFVERNYRKRGIAKMLAKVGERWAAKRGCKEMGSDAELDNVKSYAFHRAIGFKEANRIVAFIKKVR